MKSVLLILPDGFEFYEGAVFVDVLGWASDYGSEKIDVVTAGISSPIGCTFGDQRIIPNVDLNSIDIYEFDAVAIPGGFESSGFYEEAFSEVVLNTLTRFNDENKIVASICVGSIVLGRSGILKGRRATTYSYQSNTNWLDRLSEAGAIIESAPIVVDGNIITSSSPGSAVGVAFRLLEMLTSLENANMIRGMMKFN